jgi:hypothetical protein
MRNKGKFNDHLDIENELIWELAGNSMLIGTMANNGGKFNDQLDNENEFVWELAGNSMLIRTMAGMLMSTGKG